MSLAGAIQKKSLTEVEYQGIRYRLRACVGADLMQRHKALLLAVLPPNAIDLMDESAIAEATGPDKAELERLRRRELFARASDPAVILQAYEANILAICAAVVAIDVGDGWTPATIVARDEDADSTVSPEQIPISYLPAGTVDEVGRTAREISFGGEAARERIAAFRRRSVVTAPVRPDGSDLRPASE